MMRSNTEVLKSALNEHLESALVPFMSRFGFRKSERYTFTKGKKFLRVEPSSYDPLALPWMLTAHAGITGEWEKPVLSKDRMPYHTGTIEEAARSVKRLVNDLEESWIEFLKEN